MSTNKYDHLCSIFADITSTDSAIAMFFLQDVDWNIEQALDNYYNSINCEEPQGGELRLLSWNIQGIESKSFERRTRCICEEIKKGSFDIVMLQEVVPATLDILNESLGTDFSFFSQPLAEYFVSTLISKKRLKVDHFELEDFKGSRMGRGLVKTQVNFGGKRLMIMNTHLESCRQFSKERKIQLKGSFDLLSEWDSVIFGGDLNLNDKELADIGGLPCGVVDVWEAMGSRKEVEYTWDTRRNHNLGCSFVSRKRMDRIYLKSNFLVPTYFGLTGLEVVSSTQLFPSDHWGVVTFFSY